MSIAKIRLDDLDVEILNSIVHLQQLSHTGHNPTTEAIKKDLEQRSIVFSNIDVYNSLDRMEWAGMLLRHTPVRFGNYSDHYRIHPDYYPEPPIKDPYSEEERQSIRGYLLSQEEARNREEAQKREAQRIRLDALHQRDKIRRQRAKLRPKQTDYGNHDYLECPDVLKLIDEDPHRVLILDTETTGLDSYDDDVIELAIIDGTGQTLFSKRYDSWKESWDDASYVNNIWPKDVRGLPTLETDVDEISEIISKAHVVVGYNTSFDLSFLLHTGVRFHDFKICDVMEEFAEVYGDWNDYWESYTWKKLIVAARHYGIDPTGAHGALRDCQMTLEVLKRIAAEPEEIRHRPIEDDDVEYGD